MGKFWCRARIDEIFYNFLVTRMICAKNCEKLSEFVEVTVKILSVTCFFGHVFSKLDDSLWNNEAVGMC